MSENYLQHFEQRLREDLLRTAQLHNLLQDKFPSSPDIADHWSRLREHYIADAVMQVVDYPLVSVAWAAYLGMAIAYCWDVDWQTYQHAAYEDFYGDEGFDNMDDHIVRDILGLPLDSDEAIQTVRLVQNLAQHTIALIRHEDIEPQSKRAYEVFIIACHVMYDFGAAIQLERLGYRMQAVN